MKEESLLVIKLKDPIFRKYVELLFELIESNLKYNYKIVQELGIELTSDLFIFEEQIAEIPNDVIYILEKTGVIRRNPYFNNIIEVINTDVLFDAYRSLLSAKITTQEKLDRSDSELLQEVSSEDILEFLTQFVEPRIKEVQGLDKVKKIMLLQLFSERDTTMRNRIHILLLGDPGTGKTLLLQWQAKVSDGLYRSLRVTYAGLGGSVRATEFFKQEPLLKKADGRILCLDEIDKMSKEDLDPLLNAMEEGVVTLSGATMDVMYEARVRVFASANRDTFRPELKDRFDYIKYLRKLRFREISSVITHLIDFMADKDLHKLYMEGIKIIRNHIESVKNFHPKIIDPKTVSRAIIDVLTEDESADTVRHSQKWLRFVLAYARMKRANVTADLVYELYDKIKED